MSLFTPLTGILGGSLIGGSAAVCLLMNGDIMGISGILTNSIRTPFQTLRNPKHHWRWVFVASFGLTVSLYVNILNPTTSLEDTRTAMAEDVPIASWVAHLIGGFLVGLGTKLGNGCTTGHGICGIGRWSPRSLAATGVFTACSMLSTYVFSPLRKWATWTEILRTSTVPSSSPVASSLVTCVLAVLAMIRPIKVQNDGADDNETTAVDTKDLQMQENKTLGGAISGIMCAAGLAVSGMTKSSKVHDFLCLSGLSHETFDPTLVTVLCSAIGVSWLSYQFVHGFSSTRKPDQCLQTPAALPTGSPWCVPTNTVIDTELLVGASLFGFGWGLATLCPGPAMYAAFAGVTPVLYVWMPSFLMGSTLGERLKPWFAKLKNKKKVT